MERREVTRSSAYLPAVGLVHTGQHRPAAYEGQRQESRDIANVMCKVWTAAIGWAKALVSSVSDRMSSNKIEFQVKITEYI
jgi:hypothetical protein